MPQNSRVTHKLWGQRKAAGDGKKFASKFLCSFNGPRPSDGELSLDVVGFLLMRGANPKLVFGISGKTSFQLAATHCARQKL